ncbi:MAG: O-antigen ligase family protein [Rickettsiaceae bacterium]
MAMIIFLFEFLSDGYINSLFRREIQQKDSHEFYLHYLNRGCSLLSLFAWFVLAALLRKKKYVLSALIYIVLLFVFAISDSLASFVGFIAAGLVFIATRYSFLSNPKLISVVLIISSLAFISLTFLMDPYKTSNQNSFLPCSAKHRLFIWSFTAGKIAEKPIAGWGHGSSRMFQIPENNIITYEGYTFHPLPIHPHNNLSQILLENGIIGLFLYGALIIKYIFAWHKYTKSKSSALLNIRSAGYAFFVSFFVISLIAFNMWQSWWLCSYLWVALLFCNIATKEKSSIE